MGFVDKFLDKMKLGSNYDDDDYDSYDSDDEDDYVPESKPVKKKSDNAFSSVSHGSASYENTDDAGEESSSVFKSNVSKTPHRAKPAAHSSSKSSQRVVSMHERMSSMEVCVMKPVTVEDGREIADTLLNGRAVILNLEGLDVELAQRIIDFTSGACFAIQGNLQRVSNYIFVVTPGSIEISGDIQELLSESISLNAGSSTSQGSMF